MLRFMPDYRHNRVPGGTFCFTVNLLDRHSDLLVTRIDALRNAVRLVRVRAPFHIDAGSCFPTTCTACGPCRKAMPTFPVSGAIKTAFSKSMPISKPRSPVMANPGERGIWQRRYSEHSIRDDQDFAAHLAVSGRVDWRPRRATRNGRAAVRRNRRAAQRKAALQRLPPTTGPRYGPLAYAVA
jgi:putative transposase